MDDLAEDTSSKQFAGVATKLNAPKKVSQFEKARQEAESKRQREEAEAERALREFEDSFADGDDDTYGRADTREGWQGRRGLPGGFDGGSRGSNKPPPSLKRKREMEQMAEERRRHGLGRDKPGSDWRGPPRRVNVTGFTADDDDDDGMGRLSDRRSPEPKIRKPTMLLQSIPLQITEAEIRKLFPESLEVEDVSIILPPRSHRPDKRTKAAMVATAASTPASEVDKAVSLLQGTYLGFGCHLKISRHVSSTGRLSDVDTSMLFSSNKNPFGAAPRAEDETQPQAIAYNRAAPPSNFNAAMPTQQRYNGGTIQVNVNAPSDIKLLKLIHQTVERLLSHGPDFEALLMSSSGVQRDEKWAWLFDPSSTGGVYYRWLLWRTVAGSPATGKTSPSETDYLFESTPQWQPPTESLKFSGATCIEEVCDHDDYASSDDDSADEAEQRRGRDNTSSGQLINIDDVGANKMDSQSQHLNPYRRAKMTYLLARLPESIASLRSGDVARVTSFVIKNAGYGADEIVDMLICNVERPFRYSVRYGDEGNSSSRDHSAAPKDRDTNIGSDENVFQKKSDHSNAQLIALYVISDVLLTSSTSGVRDAWKYRNLMESALLSRRTFERLGRLEKEHSWGRMKGEQWKRKIGVVLDVWNSASVFPTDVWRGMKKDFLEPPLSAEEQRAKEEEEQKEKEATERAKWKSAASGNETQSIEAPTGDKDRHGPGEDKQAEALKKIAAMKAKLASTNDTATTANTPATVVAGSATEASTQTSQLPGRRSRPTAEDLFDAPEELPVPVSTPAAPTAAPISFSLAGSNKVAAPAGGDASRSVPKNTAFGGFAMGNGSDKPDDLQRGRSGDRATDTIKPKTTIMFDNDSDGD